MSKLSGPLDVTHTIKPEEVLKNLDVWRPAILKEIKGIEAAIVRLHAGTDERRQWLSKEGAQKLPMKFVFTVKAQ